MNDKAMPSTSAKAPLLPRLKKKPSLFRDLSKSDEIESSMQDKCVVAGEMIQENYLSGPLELKLEASLRAQKMENMGQLTSGIAHDFNNLLTVILGYGQMVLEDLEPGSELKSRIEPMVECSKRAASLAQQFLAFSRRQTIEPKIIDLQKLIEGSEKLLRCIVGKNIELVAIHQKKLAHVKADPGQLEQIIMNLAVNARDAMEGGGKLIVETKNVMLKDNFVEESIGLKPGNYVLLTITDTGTGMSPGIKARIFEPFFTTKEIGKGTGLGLSTVYNIVKQNNGHIEVISKLGEGSCFKIYFPQCNEALSRAKNSPPMRKKDLGGKARILVVEDDDSVRMVACTILRKAGYQVWETGDPKMAVEMFKTILGSIDLLLLDVRMPHMEGHQLAHELFALSPNLKVLFMSGFVDDDLAQITLLGEKRDILQKPFTSNSLLEIVKSVLDRVQVGQEAIELERP